MKSKALQTLLEVMEAAEQDTDRVAAAKALLKHFSDEKKRVEGKRKMVNEADSLLGEEFGPWKLTKPGANL